MLEVMVRKHLEVHNNDAQQSLAAISSASGRRRLAANRRPRRAGQPRPRQCSGEGQRFLETNAPPARRPYAAFATAGCGHTPRAGWARCSWPWTRNYREVALKEIQDSTPTPRQPGAVSCWRRRSPAGWSIPASCRSTAWDTTPTAGRSTPCVSSGATASRTPSTGFTSRRPPARPRRARSVALRKLLGRFVDVCNAVAYAHSRGVLHRDLKPGNVMLGRYGETLVVDWGLAKLLGRPDGAHPRTRPLYRASAVERRHATMAGQALGTPQYMSPEQAAGRLDLLGPASDVYSLGATLYCLLTGQPPFSRLARTHGRSAAEGAAGDFRAAAGETRGAPGAGGDLPEGDGCGRRIVTPRWRRWRRTCEQWLADEPVTATRSHCGVRTGRSGSVTEPR